MNGKGRYKDNIWIERFWRSIKQEYIYFNPADTVSELRQGIGKRIKFYNYEPRIKVSPSYCQPWSME